MSNLEHEVRTLLADTAESAPSGVELLSAVKRRSRYKWIVRHAGVAALVAVAVGVSASTIPVLLRGSADNGTQVGAVPSPSRPSPSPTPSPTASPMLRLEPVTVQPTVTFPYRPTFVPAGFPAAAVIRTQTDFLMHARQRDDSKAILVRVGATEPSAAGQPNLDGAQPVTVRGHAGKLATGGETRFLFWREKPDQWLSIESVGVSRGDLLRYAEGLRQATLQNTEAFRYALLPPGLAIRESLHYNTTFSPANAPRDADPIGGVVVTLDNPTPLAGTRVQVGNRTGYLNGGELVVDLGNQATLTVSFAGLSEQDLIRFAAGITVDMNSL